MKGKISVMNNFLKHQNLNQIKSDNVMMEQLRESKEIDGIYDTDRRIVNDIVVSSQANMLFIPLSEWISSFDEVKFVDKRSEEMEDLIASLKNELRNAAQSLGYTREDRNGYLLLH